jgi:hypothetical protein
VAPQYQPRWTEPGVLLEYLRFKPERVREPEALPRCLRAAEDFLQDYCRRQWRPEPDDVVGAGTPVAKLLRMPRRRNRLAIPDLRGTSAVSMDGLALQEGLGYELDYYGDEPAKNIRVYAASQVYVAAPRALTITGWWGWPERPGAIEDAVYRLAARLYHERAATYSDAVLLPEGGVLQYFRSLPASVQGAVARWVVPLTPGFVTVG